MSSSVLSSFGKEMLIYDHLSQCLETEKKSIAMMVRLIFNLLIIIIIIYDVFFIFIKFISIVRYS